MDDHVENQLEKSVGKGKAKGTKLKRSDSQRQKPNSSKDRELISIWNNHSPGYSLILRVGRKKSGHGQSDERGFGTDDRDNNTARSNDDRVWAPVMDFFNNIMTKAADAGPQSYCQEEQIAQNPELKEECRALQAKLEHANAWIQAHQSDLQNERSETAKLKSSAEKMVASMERKDLFLGPQEADSIIVSNFMTLIARIRTWAAQFAYAHPLTFEGIEERTLNELFDIGVGMSSRAQFEALLSNRKQKRLFFQGLIGLTLIAKVLPGGSQDGIGTRRSPALDIWMGKSVARAMRYIETAFAGSGMCLFKCEARSLAKSLLDDLKLINRALRLYHCLSS
jgi:hypothetical protein